jgi:hypothetical protein
MFAALVHCLRHQSPEWMKSRHDTIHYSTPLLLLNAIDISILLLYTTSVASDHWEYNYYITTCSETISFTASLPDRFYIGFEVWKLEHDISVSSHTYEHAFKILYRSTAACISPSWPKPFWGWEKIGPQLVAWPSFMFELITSPLQNTAMQKYMLSYYVVSGEQITGNWDGFLEICEKIKERKGQKCHH